MLLRTLNICASHHSCAVSFFLFFRFLAPLALTFRLRFLPGAASEDSLASCPRPCASTPTWIVSLTPFAFAAAGARSSSTRRRFGWPGWSGSSSCGGRHVRTNSALGRRARRGQLERAPERAGGGRRGPGPGRAASRSPLPPSSGSAGPALPRAGSLPVYSACYREVAFNCMHACIYSMPARYQTSA